MALALAPNQGSDGFKAWQMNSSRPGICKDQD